MTRYRLVAHPSDKAISGTEWDLEALEEAMDGSVRWFLKATIYEREIALLICQILNVQDTLGGVP